MVKNTRCFFSTVVGDECDTLEFGCCPDLITPAKGPDYRGCPESELNFTSENITLIKPCLNVRKSSIFIIPSFHNVTFLFVLSACNVTSIKDIPESKET